MSETDTRKIAPKPFLKKGTRQFLSNAQVRSQAQKPKIVEYTDEDTFPTQSEKLIQRNEDFQIPIKATSSKKM